MQRYENNPFNFIHISIILGKTAEKGIYFAPFSYLCRMKSAFEKTMNIIRLLIPLLGLAAAACGGASPRRAPAAPEPREYTYRVVASYPHDTAAYTQGLQYADGLLWEGTGEYGRSELRTTDLATGRVRTVSRLPQGEFGEGIALLDSLVYQLTWESNTCHVYRRATGEKLRDFRYPGEGWGLATDGRQLYLSNGSADIYTIDPATFRRTGSRTVTYKGAPVRFLNELEWIEGRLWANVYTTDGILMIDPATGVAEGLLDLTGLLPESERTPATDVLNGIAYDPAAKRIFVTGKRWPKIYQIEVIER